jgi:hypothetical protein
MPLQNRVTPFGEIVAIPERGTMMGNRGILHDAHQRLRRQWAGRAWICCLLEFRGRRDPVMAPGHYTRLFFLDELTALAAGHRPCAYCRRDEYNAFRAAWAEGNPHLGPGEALRAPQMDALLQQERIGPGLSKRLHPVTLETLPDGVFVTHDVERAWPRTGPIVRDSDRAWFLPTEAGTAGSTPEVFMLWRGGHWLWTSGGYETAAVRLTGTVLALTPPSIVGALAGGYVPRPPFGLDDGRR